MPKLLFFITEDWTFYSHRLPLARAALKAGFEVTLLTNVHAHGDKIKEAGINLVPIALRRRSMNPFRELITVWQVINVYRSVKPDIVHHVAMKPVLYGSIAALVTGIPRVVNALAGMGYVFIAESFNVRLLRAFIKSIFSILLNLRQSRLILQNPDDVSMLVEHGVVENKRVNLIRGSGVDVTQFAPSRMPPPPVTVILPARMLFDKGVAEFVEAARTLKSEGCHARFVLVGGLDPANPAHIPEAQLRLWQLEQVVEWWGHRTDMPDVLAQAHIVCLPSYREGLPKALLEAASCGRPIVTTDVPGCREIVRHGVNGFLVPARDSRNLANSLRTLIDSPGQRAHMGKKGREMALAEFSEEQIVRETLDVYEKLLPGCLKHFDPDRRAEEPANILHSLSPEVLPSCKILVTGANGFIGRSLCSSLLLKNCQVRGTLRSSDALSSIIAGVDPVIIDTLGADTEWQSALENIDIVIHLAARLHIMDEPLTDPLAEFLKVNTEGTKKLAQEAVRAGVKRFVFVSSIKVNGEEAPIPYTEDSPENTVDPYGFSKLEAERFLRNLETETGMEITIIRPPLVYGPGVKANFLNMMEVISSGTPLPLSSIDNKRSLIFSGNLVDALVTCAVHPAAAGQTYLVSDGEDISTPELIRRTAAALNVKVRLFPIPISLLAVAGKLTGKSAAVDRLTGTLTVDTAKIRRELGWTPPLSMEEGLRATATWFRKRQDDQK